MGRNTARRIQKIYVGNIIEGFKYEVKSGFHVPLRILCDMFYKPNIKKEQLNLVFGAIKELYLQCIKYF
jgi:hypothetical protein